MSGGRSYGGIHGQWHAPRGSDPARTEPWRDIVDSGTPWSSLTNYDIGDEVDNNYLRYECINACGPSTVDRFGNTVGPIEPDVDAHWMTFWWAQASIWVNGGNAGPSVDVANPTPGRYRLSVGPPHVLDTDGSVIAYSEHQIEIHGDFDVNVGDTVFFVAHEYRPQYDIPITNQHDDIGLYGPCRLLSTGEFIYGHV